MDARTTGPIPSPAISAPRVVEAGRATEAPAMFPTAAAVGSAIVVAYSTVPDGWPGGEVRVTRSLDGGSTWSDGVTVAAPRGDEQAVLGALGMTALANGDLVLPVNTIRWDGPSTSDRVAGLRLLTSSDRGETWSDIVPAVEFHWPAVYGALIEDGDDLLWPIWGRYRAGERWRAAVLSSPQGENGWSLRGTIAYDPAARLLGDYVHDGNADLAEGSSETTSAAFRPHDATDGFSETSVCRLADGSLLAIIRQQGVGGDDSLRLFRAWSYDAGATWTTAVPVGFSGMSPALHRLPDDTLLLASRRHVPVGSGLTPGVEIRRGSADGLTWSDPSDLRHPDGIELTEEYQCGYPTIIDDGAHVRVFFYTFEEGAGRFIAWNLVDPGSDVG